MLPGWHVPPWQQPVGQDVASHTHAPPAQRWPAPHAGSLPHAHAPERSQPSLVAAAQPAHTQTPAAHERPGGQGSPPPQLPPRPL